MNFGGRKNDFIMFCTALLVVKSGLLFLIAPPDYVGKGIKPVLKRMST